MSGGKLFMMTLVFCFYQSRRVKGHGVKGHGELPLPGWGLLAIARFSVNRLALCWDTTPSCACDFWEIFAQWCFWFFQRKILPGAHWTGDDLASHHPAEIFILFHFWPISYLPPDSTLTVLDTPASQASQILFLPQLDIGIWWGPGFVKQERGSRVPNSHADFQPVSLYEPLVETSSPEQGDGSASARCPLFHATIALLYLPSFFQAVNIISSHPLLSFFLFSSSFWIWSL